MEGLEVLNTTNDNKWNIIVNCILCCATEKLSFISYATRLPT